MNHLFNIFAIVLVTFIVGFKLWHLYNEQIIEHHNKLKGGK